MKFADYSSYLNREESKPTFESIQWLRDKHMENTDTPVITPGYLSGSNTVDETGTPILDKITFGMHWRATDYPAWTGNQISKDATNELNLPSTPASLVPSHAHRYLSHGSGDHANARFAPPFGIEHIAAMTDQIRQVLGFQFDVSVNVFELLMSQLDSRASRSCPKSALRSLHSDYISGPHANYRKWYFASQMDQIDHEHELKESSKVQRNASESAPEQEQEQQSFDREDKEEKELSLSDAEAIWNFHHGMCSDAQKVIDLLIYLFCWSEANQVRFMPECLAFTVKCCRSYYFANFPVYPQLDRKTADLPSDFFLNSVITPLYNCYRSYNYTCTDDGTWIRREGDHKDFIGYDDMNQLFWFRKGLERICVESEKYPDYDSTKSHCKLISLPPNSWLLELAKIDWTRAFFKSYRESRSWLHNITNFSRIWILHASVFWFYTSFNMPSLYTTGYNYLSPKPPKMFVRLTIMSIGGLVGPISTFIGLIGEARFVPRDYPGAKPILPRLLIVIILCLILGLLAGLNLILNPWDVNDVDLMPATVISGVALALAILYTLYFSFQPLGHIIGATGIKMKFNDSDKAKRQFLANTVFTANFAKRNRNDHILSWTMCLMTFIAKFTESYFFLTLSVRDPLRELGLMNIEDHCIGDKFLFGAVICKVFPKIILVFVLITDIILFFLDTYLWYVIFNTIISVSIAFKDGASVWTPWRNVYSRLSHRITTKLLAPSTSTRSADARACALRVVWNSIVDSMLRTHILSREQAIKLIYVSDDTSEPRFFTMEEDGKALETDSRSSTAYRRISFFAQSLSTPMKPATAVHEMPSFTVMIPHYKEKLILSLGESIREEQGAKITILEYLQRLYPNEWENLVHELQQQKYDDYIATHDSSLDETRVYNSGSSTNSVLSSTSFHTKGHQIALKKLGFYTLDPNDTTRTRLWCSERTQTLYRTLRGFSNYSNALRVLYCAENSSDQTDAVKSSDQMMRHISELCCRKFRLLVAMQLYTEFTDDQLQQVEIVMRMIPELTVSYVERDVAKDEYYSCLFDSSCPLLDTGRRQPKMRIKLSGSPFLGDGKSDNQNSTLPYYRGEYIQLVDANQDNYIEECLKIRNILMEFEVTPVSYMSAPVPSRTTTTSTFINGMEDPIGIMDFKDIEAFPEIQNSMSILSQEQSPIAIVGAREYILSENFGVLGDVAAGKEQTFGTLFSRTLAKVGAKLHYGHPDFLNAIFMTTRGGVSKGQRGLHLNEDIYAGMMAILRGGRIRHSEYFQCGKGRDLGFVSILNFTAKIGAGMAEQMLSREYFYMGTQLPFDRFINFYYAHPGFHLNNVFIMLSLEMLLMVMLWISSIASVSTTCIYERRMPVTSLHRPTGCANILAIVDWIRRCVVSIFLVFFISLCPLFFQELTEKGLVKSLIRVAKHFSSLSMLFEVFVCRIYARSFCEDMNIGGAKYVATGRGMATSRLPFYTLYSGYYSEILCGMKAAGILTFSSIILWSPCYLWFWVTTVSLCICPVLYNPHQFAFTDFFVDYRDLIMWFWNAVANHEDNDNAKITWVKFTRDTRKKLTGEKERSSGYENTKPAFKNAIVSQVGISILTTISLGLPYIFIGTQRVSRYQDEPENSPLLRVLVLAAIPMCFSAVISVICCLLSSILHMCQVSKHGNITAMTAHTFSLLSLIFSWWVLYILESRSFHSTLLGIIVICSLHNLLNLTLTVVVLQKQRKTFESSDPWWTGNWDAAGLGWRFPLVFAEEFVIKSIIEPMEYNYDFMACHTMVAIQVPLLLVPYIDKLHTLFLMWLRPSVTAAASRSMRIKRDRAVVLDSLIFSAVFILISGLIILLLVFPVLVPESWLAKAEEELVKLVPW